MSRPSLTIQIPPRTTFTLVTPTSPSGCYLEPAEVLTPSDVDEPEPVVLHPQFLPLLESREGKGDFYSLLDDHGGVIVSQSSSLPRRIRPESFYKALVNASANIARLRTNFHKILVNTIIYECLDKSGAPTEAFQEAIRTTPQPLNKTLAERRMNDLRKEIIELADTFDMTGVHMKLAVSFLAALVVYCKK